MNVVAQKPKKYLDLPHNPLAEKRYQAALLAGAFAGNREPIKRFSKHIKPKDFFKQGAQNFYRRILELNAQSRPFDECVLVESFRGDPDYFLYRDYADQLEPVTIGIAAHYGKIVLEYSLRRQVILLFAEGLDEAQDLSLSLPEILQKIVQKLEELIDREASTCL